MTDACAAADSDAGLRDKSLRRSSWRGQTEDLEGRSPAGTSAPRSSERATSATGPASVRRRAIATTVSPKVSRGFEGGPEGLELVAIGGRKPEGGGGGAVRD